MLWFYEKHLSGVVSNLEPIPQCYGFMITSCKYLIILPLTQQKRERKLLTTKQNENLNKQNLSFPMNKTTKEKLQQNNFSNYFTFSPTEINRTPRSLL